MIVVNAKGAVLGKVAAFSAKKALTGETVRVINVEQAVISGRREKTTEKYAKRRNITNKSNPENASKWPVRPDFMFKRIVQGMLPKHTSRAKQALSRIKAVMGDPDNLSAKAVPEKFEHKNFQVKTITLKQLCTSLGWKHGN